MMAEPPPEGTSNTFTGGAEAIIQTGPVHGDVHLHRPALAKFPPPRQLPMDVPRFVNRDEQLAALDAVLTATEDDTRSATVVVSAVAGAPGVGKTTLAVHWAHRVRHRFPDGDLYVNLRGYGPRSALPTDQALEFFLRALDVAPERVPIGTEPRAALYRSLLNGLRVLVIIDNAASASQVRPLLPVASTCLAVVTSRDRLSGLIVREGAAPVVLDVLTPDESFDLLRQVVGAQRVDAEPAAAARIARQCGYLPLALRIVAERLAGRPYMTLSEIGNELDDERSRLDALTSDDELADVRAVFSWSYGALTPDVARLFRLLGLHTGADISTPAVAALTGTTLTRVRRLLDVLTGAHLLQQTAAARYRLHDLLRTYVAERAEVDEPPDQRRRALRRVLRWYLLTAANARREFLPDLDPRVLEPTDEDDPTDPQVFAGVDEAMAWFEAERLNLLDALEQAVASGQNDLAVKIPRAIGGFFEVRAYWRDYQYVYRHGLQASRMMGDHYWELSSLVGLGDAERVLRRYDEAVDYYSQAVRISEEIGDQRREGFALRGMGMVHQERGQYDRAVEYYQLALSAFERAGVRRGEGMCWLSLGDCHRAVGRLTDAIQHSQRAQAIFREAGDRLTEGLSLNSLGLSYGAASQALKAIEQHRAALDIFRVFDDPHGEALSLLHLGDALHANGESDRARESWSEALGILDRIGAAEADSARRRLRDAAGETS